MTLTNRLQNNLLGNLDDFIGQAIRSFGSQPVSRVPDAYRYESDEQYRLRLDLPGFAKEDISLSLEDGQVTVKAKTENEDSFRNEYERSFTLPEDANPEGIAAKLDHGVLELTFQKVAPQEPAVRNIEIN